MKNLKDKTVLIVDDEKEYVEAIADEFLDIGCKVLKAYNGEEALQFLIKEQKVDLIISDIRMPKMDGKELLQKIRDSYTFTPVIMFITGHSDLRTDEAYNLGADSIFSKPFKMSLLLEAAEKSLTPFDEKFSIPLNDIKEEVIVNSESCANMGRGGISFCSNSTNLKSGQEINFKVNYPGKENLEVKGQGIVRWSTKSEHDCPNFIGVEFQYISPETREQILEAIIEKKSRSFIPNKCLKNKVRSNEP